MFFTSLADSGIVGVFSWVHILFMALVFPIFVLSLFLIKKYVKNEKTITIILYVAAALLLAAIITQRIDIAYQNIKEGTIKHTFWGEDRKYNWWMILPDSVCGFTSLVLPFVIWFGKKKDNFLMEAIFTVSILGFLGTTIYPDYLNVEPIYQARCWGGLVHHVISGWISCLMLITKRFEFHLKRWYLNPIYLAIMAIYGVFCLFVLNFATCMNISSPMMKELDPITYCWGMSIAYFLANMILILIFDKSIRKKKENKEKPLEQ